MPSSSKPNRLAVTPRITGRHIAFHLGVARQPNKLACTKVLVRVIDHLHAVTTLGQTLNSCLVHGRFDRVAVQVFHLLLGDRLDLSLGHGARDVAAMKMVEGSARSMGLEVKG